MPPRYSYWTIIAGGLPTAFRAAEQDDLLPTFKRIQEKHPDAEMKWFARGKLWESPAAAREDTEKRRLPPEGHRPPGGRRPARVGEHRGRDWRPGGEHRDPRQKFIDAKKDRNQDRRKQRFERKQGLPSRSREAADVGPPREKPQGPTLRQPQGRPEQSRGAKAPFHKPGTRDTREKRDWRDRPPRQKPQGEPPRGDGSPKSGRPPGARPPVGRAFQPRPAGPTLRQPQGRPEQSRGAKRPPHKRNTPPRGEGGNRRKR